MNPHVIHAIKQLVWSGFFEEERILEIIMEEMFEPGEIDEALTLSQIKSEFAQKIRDEASWPTITDCDRLDQIFSELNQAGIIALQNAGYTQSDGMDDITQLYNEQGGIFSSIQGYCFYHGQDVERAVDGHGLFITFGDIKGTDEKGIEIGARIIATIERHGLIAKWSGSLSQRIEIPKINWQRRTAT